MRPGLRTREDWEQVQAAHSLGGVSMRPGLRTREDSTVFRNSLLAGFVSMRPGLRTREDIRIASPLYPIRQFQ